MWNMMGAGWGSPFGDLLWVLVVTGVALILWRYLRPEISAASGPAVLDARYARGEIGRDEYLQKKSDISKTAAEGASH
jgi:putative membrane protein